VIWRADRTVSITICLAPYPSVGKVLGLFCEPLDDTHLLCTRSREDTSVHTAGSLTLTARRGCQGIDAWDCASGLLHHSSVVPCFSLSGSSERRTQQVFWAFGHLHQAIHPAEYRLLSLQARHCLSHTFGRPGRALRRSAPQPLSAHRLGSSRRLPGVGTSYLRTLGTAEQERMRGRH